jgi:YebC/PmpR family DNA-binding regulatory protein
MSGHSKWATIKHKKGALDAKKGKIFSKLVKEITVAARIGGGDPVGNARLRKALSDAKAQSMPADNIERAIKKGTGELAGVSYEEFSLEGYGPGGAAILVQVTSDNRNRSVGDIRHIFSKYGGNMGEAGCVSWMFEKKGLLTVPRDAAEEDSLLEIALEAGANDVVPEDEEFEVYTDPASFEAVRKALEDRKIKVTAGEVTMHPQSTVRLEGKQAEQMLKLMDMLEDHDDVSNVYANFDIPDEVMEKINA